MGIVGALRAKGFFHLLSVNLLAQALGLGTILVVAKFLSPRELGEVRILQSYTALIIAVAAFGYDTAILKVCSEARPLEERLAILRLGLGRPLPLLPQGRGQRARRLGVARGRRAAAGLDPQRLSVRGAPLIGVATVRAPSGLISATTTLAPSAASMRAAFSMSLRSAGSRWASSSRARAWRRSAKPGFIAVF